MLAARVFALGPGSALSVHVYIQVESKKRRIIFLMLSSVLGIPAKAETNP